jgi:hypothetical protein
MISPPIFRIRVLGDCCLALAMLGLGIYHDFIRIFEIKKTISARFFFFLLPSFAPQSGQPEHPSPTRKYQSAVKY